MRDSLLSIKRSAVFRSSFRITAESESFICRLPGETLSHPCTFAENQRGGLVGEQTSVCVFSRVNNQGALNVSE